MNFFENSIKKVWSVMSDLTGGESIDRSHFIQENKYISLLLSGMGVV